MTQSLAIPRVIPENWKRLDLIINKIKFHLGSAASPTFAGITVTGLTASSLVGTNAGKALESVTVGTGLDYTRPNLTLSHLGIEDLTDPGSDKILFWDDSATACKWLGVGNSIAITTTTIDTIQDIRTTASPTLANLSLGTGELTAGSINRASGTLTLEIGGTAEISITSTTVTLGGNLVIPDTGYIGSASDPNAIQIAVNGEVTFTDVITGILPTAGAHLATKEYVDLAIGSSRDYFLSDNDDAGIANYHILYETDTGEAASDEETVAMGINPNQLMFSFITASGVPGVTFLRSGVYVTHTHLAMTTGNRTVVFYWTLSKYALNADETVLMTSEVSSAIPGSMASFITHAVLSSDATILSTDRLVLKLYANVTGGGANSVITIYMEGSNDCHITNLLPSDIWQNQGDVLDDLNTLGINSADSEFLVGTGAGALTWESGATARTSIGLGTGNTPTFTALTLIDGNNNTIVGEGALSSNTTGTHNLAIGYRALYTNTTGYYNTAVGVVALYFNQTGYYNTAVGYAALYTNTTGYHNTAMGYRTLFAVKPTGKTITAFADYGGTVAGTVKATSVGHGLTGAVANIGIYGTTNYNGVYTITVIDVDNFYFTDTWVSDDATGWWGKDTEGRHNIGIGYQAGDNITTGSNNIIIGYDIDASAAGIDYELNIGGLITGRLDAPKSVTVAGTITASNYTAAALLTACASNAGELDFTAASKKLDVEDNAVVSQDYSSDASPQFTGIELGHASDTTITRVSAGVIAVEGTTIMLVGDAATAHAILDGSVHSDSVADAVTRGSIIYGNSTPKWDELVLGGANTFLGSDSTDLSYRSAAQVMASLSGAAGAGFSFNSQALTSVGAIGCGAVTGTSTAIFEGASVAIGKASTTTGTLVLHDSNSANTITLTVPNISAGSLTFTLPPTDGDNLDVLQTNGSGVLTWIAHSGGQTQGDVLDDLNTLGANPFSGDPNPDFLVGTSAGTLAWHSGATARTSIGLGNVENTQLSTWAGTTNITTLGTITTVGNITFGDTASLTFGVNLAIISAQDAVRFRNTQVNERSVFQVIPNGTVAVAASALEFFGTDYIADTTNYERLLIYAHAASYEIYTHAAGTGTVRPLILYTSGNANQLNLMVDGGITMATLKSGTDQANAGAAAGELYFDTNDDNTVKMGV